MRKPVPKSFGTGLFVSATEAESGVERAAPIRREGEAAFDGRVDGDPEGLASPLALLLALVIGTELAIFVFTGDEYAEVMKVLALVIPEARIDTANGTDLHPDIGFFEDFSL